MKSSSVKKPSEFPKSNGTQRKYLRERLSAAGRPYFGSRNRDREPTDIVAMRKKIDAWEKQQRKDREAEESVFDKAREKANEAILFDSAENALKLVVAYEQLVEAHRG